MNKTAALIVKDLSLRYRVKKSLLGYAYSEILNNVSFEIYEGETLGLIGRNGAGKSSLLRLLAGIMSPDRGEIVRNVANVSLLTLQLGFLPHFTGVQNAILSGMLMGVPRRLIEEKLEDIKIFSGIGDKIFEPVSTYSSGMKARLGFSVALYCEPDVVLLDEVLGVGDAEFKIKSSMAIRQKIMSNKTFVLVSHSGNVIKELCDRVVWLDGRSVKMVGNPSDVLKEYGESIGGVAQHG